MSIDSPAHDELWPAQKAANEKNNVAFLLDDRRYSSSKNVIWSVEGIQCEMWGFKSVHYHVV